VIYVYCARWHHGMCRPIDVMTEEEAWLRYAARVPGPANWFTVAAWHDGRDVSTPPDFLLEVMPYAGCIKARYLDQWHRIRYSFSLTRTGDQLFQSQVVEHHYPAVEGFLRRRDAVLIDRYEYREDGYGRWTRTDCVRSDVEVREYREVPVDEMYEVVPLFGSWEHVGRWRG
jgi:hypothetical protein